MTSALIPSIQALRERLAAQGAGPVGPVGLVPTMGALHAGHASLIDRARAECGQVIVSIFVNPLQFDRADDLARYPRPLEADLELCSARGVDVVFAPAAVEMYPTPPICAVDVGRLGDHLCGRSRPGHFRGVATVVLKLFEIVQPYRAYFGEKDAQQLAIVRRLVKDFNVPVEIIGMPTVRDADGLALSSRNRHLKSGDRRLALSLIAALREAERQIASGVSDAGLIREAAVARIPSDPRVRLEYLEVVDLDEMQPVPVINVVNGVNAPVCVAAALWVESTRLIDNVVCRPPRTAPEAVQ
jgi:pantoate--beta-alanine ligase